jgi:hypothetical protein
MINYIAIDLVSYSVIKTHSLFVLLFSLDVRDVSAKSSYKLSVPLTADS